MTRLPQNPFVVRREIAYGEPFCDREQEIRTFMESAESDEPVCLLSPRRYGKSSLVNQVLGRLAEKGWVTLRLDLMTVRSLPGLQEALEGRRLEASSGWTRVKRRAADAVSRLHPQLHVDPATGTPTFSVDLSSPRSGEESALAAALEKMSSLPASIDKPVCLALDEFQEVTALDPKGRVVGMIRSAFQRRSRGFFPIYLGSRRHMLKMMFEKEAAPLYRSARMLELKELQGDDFANFVVHHFRETTGTVLPKSIGTATAALFGGYPHALNLTASRLWTAQQLAGERSAEFIRSAWKEIVTTIIQEERAYYQQINRNVSRTAMNVLANVARRGIVAGPYTAEFARQCRLTPGQIQTALRLLMKEDKVLETREGYVVFDPLEALCLRTEGVAPESLDQELDRLLEAWAEEE
ncbi:MAG: ATP-binding protein [Deltaproteobacteria bacterium]|nr:ATP-binding protein [Deltaproteobacteria bacterium]